MLHLLLADDDRDDRFLFNEALTELNIPAKLDTVTDGEKLMNYLAEHASQLPDLLFLDLNMPRKTGHECLADIKQTASLCQLPVVIYSTSLRDDIGDKLYQAGAHYYIQKTDIPGLQKILTRLLTMVNQKQLDRPDRTRFMLSAETNNRLGIHA